MNIVLFLTQIEPRMSVSQGQTIRKVDFRWISSYIKHKQTTMFDLVLH